MLKFLLGLNSLVKLIVNIKDETTLTHGPNITPVRRYYPAFDIEYNNRWKGSKLVKRLLKIWAD